MLKAENTSFYYGRIRIINNASARFECGKLYAVIGVNGSGKTTFINLLSRLLKPNSGKLSIEGVPYAEISRREFSTLVSLCPQIREIPDVSVYDYVSAGRFPYRSTGGGLSREDRRHISSALEMTGLSELVDESLVRLSGGERQRVYLAMSAAQDTPYVILDEPTTYLDISCSHKILHLLVKMRDKGKCVIAILHDISMAIKYADEIILIDKGEIVFCGSRDELITQDLIPTVFGADVKSVDLDGETQYIFKPR